MPHCLLIPSLVLSLSSCYMVACQSFHTCVHTCTYMNAFSLYNNVNPLYFSNLVFGDITENRKPATFCTYVVLCKWSCIFLFLCSLCSFMVYSYSVALWYDFKRFFSRLLSPDISQGASDYYVVMLFFDTLCLLTIVFGVSSFGVSTVQWYMHIGHYRVRSVLT